MEVKAEYFRIYRIYNNIEKDYDLDIFYENPELAKMSLVQYHYMSLIA